jgi:hypothetical protein
MTPPPLTFPRPALDAALSAALDDHAGGGRARPSRLPSRIRKLLDLDRELTQQAPAGTGRAFTDHAGLGQGVDAAYTPLNAFCLALGLELLEAGFKQSEVVTWVRLTRPWLAREYPRILAGPAGAAVPRTQLALPGRSDRCYMVVSRILALDELPEVEEAVAGAGSRRTPVTFAPKFFHGPEDLAAALARSPSNVRRWLIIECRMLAVRLHNALLATRHA